VLRISHSGESVCRGDAADTLVEEVALEADVDEFFGQTEGALEKGDDQRVRESPGEQGDATADGAGVGADECGDLAEGVAAGESEVEEVLVGGREFAESVENLGARLF